MYYSTTDTTSQICRIKKIYILFRKVFGLMNKFSAEKKCVNIYCTVLVRVLYLMRSRCEFMMQYVHIFKVIDD